ncbi:MAG: hypothetical protein WBA93_09360 [Microcoleaceae cyanobacterium]
MRHDISNYPNFILALLPTPDQTQNPGDLVTATTAIKPPGFQTKLTKLKKRVSCETAILTNQSRPTQQQ